jgi:hypothetical protein
MYREPEREDLRTGTASRWSIANLALSHRALILRTKGKDAEYLNESNWEKRINNISYK